MDSKISVEMRNKSTVLFKVRKEERESHQYLLAKWLEHEEVAISYSLRGCCLGFIFQL